MVNPMSFRQDLRNLVATTESMLLCIRQAGGALSVAGCHFPICKSANHQNGFENLISRFQNYIVLL